MKTKAWTPSSASRNSAASARAAQLKSEEAEEQSKEASGGAKAASAARTLNEGYSSQGSTADSDSSSANSSGAEGSSYGGGQKTSSSKEPAPLADMLNQAKVRDGSGQPIQSAGGPTLAAQGPKEALQDRVTDSMVEGFTQGVFLKTRGTPQAHDIEPTLRAMSNQIVDAALDNPERSAAAQKELVQDIGAMHSAERAERLSGEVHLFKSVAGNLREGLTEGDASEKLATLQQLNEISQTLAPESPQYGAAVTSPEMGQLGADLRSGVPDVAPLVDAQYVLGAVEPMLAKSDSWGADTRFERAEIAQQLRETAADLKDGGPPRAQAATHLQALADGLDTGDAEASRSALSSTQNSLNEAIESTAKEATSAFNGAMGESVQAGYQSAQANYKAASEASSKYTGETAGAWSALEQADPSWGQMAEPLRALADARDAGTLRELLGDAAKDFSDADLTKAISPQDESKAKEMGLTRQRVQEAAAELKDAALGEGRPASSVDSTVALEALVGQERALEEMQREDPQFALESREPEPEKSFFEEGRQQDSGAEHEEREAELEMDGGD